MRHHEDAAYPPQSSPAMVLTDGGRSTYRAPGYRMVDSVKIQNFRSFAEERIDDCRRINIIVGENGSGKTAFLEAIFLALGVSPELVVRTRTWRGFEGKLAGTQEDIHQALWADIFHKFQTNRQALVSLRGTNEQTRSVTVTLYRRGQMRVVAPKRNKSGAPPKVVPERSPIEFKWKIQGYPDVTVKPTFEGENLVLPPIPDSYVKAAFLSANRTFSGAEVANRFSQLSRSFREREFTDKFSELYPNIKNISIELSAGSPMLFAAVTGVPEKIPLSLASGGMNKLAAIMLAMSDQAGGVILVDEIENGFYHKRLPIIWKALLEFSRLYDCQLFVSSHSRECLEAAAELAEEHPKEFSVIQTAIRDGSTKLNHFGGENFVDAMEENIEIR